jgi:16S rRNA (cytosine967-C5)-methyltransferase
VVSPQSVAKLPGFVEGLFTVQDPSASNAAALLDPQPGWMILDLCAAPGTKTTQLAELTQDAAQIIATDIDASRLTRVHENLTRLGVGSVTVIRYCEVAQKTPAGYDAILLDVPCSNTGVLAKRVEARFRLGQSPAQELVRTQRALLEKAATLLKPGGRICYSTCSVQRAENSDLIRSFLKANRQFELVAEELLLPKATGFDHDGAYAAILAQTP